MKRTKPPGSMTVSSRRSRFWKRLFPFRRHKAQAQIPSQTVSPGPESAVQQKLSPLSLQPRNYAYTQVPIRPAPQIAQVYGSTEIPQIVVGAPSPPVEPSAIADTYRSFPFQSDTVIDGWSSYAMTLRGATMRGHLHRTYGAPRQDDFTMHQMPDGRAIITVADGVSQAPHSHFGANTATRFAANWLRTHLTSDTEATDWTNLVRSTAWALNERAQRLLDLSEPNPVRTEQEFATTLICAVVEPTDNGRLRAFLVSCGDSSAWVLSQGQFVDLAGGKSDTPSGITSSEVVGLPRVPSEVVPVVVDLNCDDVLLIATDGIGDPLGSGEGGVGNLFRAMFSRPTLPSLIEFAHAVDFSRETFDDDRSLVAVWPRRYRQAQPDLVPMPPQGTEGIS